MQDEIIWDTRSDATVQTRTSRDSVIYTFKNGSTLENVALSEKTRGKRYQSGLVEEAAMVDNQELLNEVILPEECGA